MQNSKKLLASFIIFLPICRNLLWENWRKKTNMMSYKIYSANICSNIICCFHEALRIDNEIAGDITEQDLVSNGVVLGDAKRLIRLFKQLPNNIVVSNELHSIIAQNSASIITIQTDSATEDNLYSLDSTLSQACSSAQANSVTLDSSSQLYLDFEDDTSTVSEDGENVLPMCSFSSDNKVI
jgi:hypothetical protein